MATTCVLGAQWGDEGKARVVDLLADTADIDEAGAATINYGVWMIHAGIIMLALGSVYYFGTKKEGDTPVVRRTLVAKLQSNPVGINAGQRLAIEHDLERLPRDRGRRPALQRPRLDPRARGGVRPPGADETDLFVRSARPGRAPARAHLSPWLG